MTFAVAAPIVLAADACVALAHAAQRAAAGEPWAVAVVVATSGSAPRHAGALLALGPDGQLGTIGGGRVEALVVATLAGVRENGDARIVTPHLVRDLAMCCGGAMQVLCVRLPQGLAARLHAWVQNGEAAEWSVARDGAMGWHRRLAQGAATDVTWPPAQAGALPPEVSRGAAWHFVCARPPRAVIFGAGHVAEALGPLLHSIGYAVVVCDDGEVPAAVRIAEGATWVSARIDSLCYRDVCMQIGPLGGRDVVLIVTRDHALDQRIVEELLPEGAIGYIGLIGSARKIAQFGKRLVHKGLIDRTDAPQWQRIVAPVGLAIGAQTPAEIAIAIAAQVVAWRQTGQLHAHRWRASLAHERDAHG